jgi:hypothetical protein
MPLVPRHGQHHIADRTELCSNGGVGVLPAGPTDPCTGIPATLGMLAALMPTSRSSQQWIACCK